MGQDFLDTCIFPHTNNSLDTSICVTAALYVQHSALHTIFIHANPNI